MSTLTTELWDSLGALDEEEAFHVLTKLFETYEALYDQHPEDSSVADFFKRLDRAMQVTRECNLNRR